MSDLGLLLLRLVVGGLLAGHGAQKQFGVFGGHGFSGTAGFLEQQGLKPGHVWAGMATAGEFGGGLMTVFGLGAPLGSIMTMAAMLMAAVKGHSGKPIWNTEGGAELPMVNIAASLALALTGPGACSLDRLFGIRIPRWLTALFTIGAFGTVLYGAMTEPAPQPDEQAGSTGSGQAAA